jgi:hypothetical protein
MKAWKRNNNSRPKTEYAGYNQERQDLVGLSELELKVSHATLCALR